MAIMITALGAIGAIVFAIYGFVVKDIHTMIFGLGIALINIQVLRLSQEQEKGA